MGKEVCADVWLLRKGYEQGKEHSNDDAWLLQVVVLLKIKRESVAGSADLSPLFPDVVPQ